MARVNGASLWRGVTSGVFALIVFGAVLGLSGQGAMAGSNLRCDDGTVYLRGGWGSARFSVEIADTGRKRARGLMYRQALPRSAGMLFVYHQVVPVAFWMKNTLIPLDMVFLDETGTVVNVHHMAVPHDLRPIPGGEAVKAVLEINGGLARALGITEGSQMLHPSFDPEIAAWPCQ